MLTAAGTPSAALPGTLVAGLTRRPALSAQAAQRGLRDWCVRQRLDVVVTNSATASALVRIAEVPAPVVYFCHGLHWNRLRTLPDLLWQSVEHQLLARTAAVITINSDDEAWFRQRMPEHTVLRIAAGVGLALDSYPRTPLPAGPLRLAWIGEHSERKRPWLAVEVAGLLRRRGIDVTLTMIGTGDRLERTRARIRAAGLTDRVHAVGWGDAAGALADSHALLHTATWEGLPRVMLEAIAVGRRSYAFDVKGVRDIPGAVLVPDGDVAGLAAAIGADAGSGLLREPVATDPGFLASDAVAGLIRTFLAGVIAPAEHGRAAAG